MDFYEFFLAETAHKLSSSFLKSLEFSVDRDLVTSKVSNGWTLYFWNMQLQELWDKVSVIVPGFDKYLRKDVTEAMFEEKVKKIIKNMATNYGTLRDIVHSKMEFGYVFFRELMRKIIDDLVTDYCRANNFGRFDYRIDYSGIKELLEKNIQKSGIKTEPGTSNIDAIYNHFIKYILKSYNKTIKNHEEFSVIDDKFAKFKQVCISSFNYAFVHLQSIGFLRKQNKAPIIFSYSKTGGM